MYRVLIIEDDPMVAAIDRQYVEMDPAFQVVQLCRDGQEGLNFLECHPVDLIILDFYTPAMTGLDFVDRLHAIGRIPAIIMVTSANDTAIVQGLLARGVLDYLVKPFQRDRFQQALDRFRQTRGLLEREPGCLDQNSIDELVGSRHLPPAPSQSLPKGLNASTLEHVRSFFAAHPRESFTSEEVAEQVGLSRITIRRYVSFMTDGGEIASTIDYQTGGRPAIRYSRTEKDP